MIGVIQTEKQNVALQLLAFLTAPLLAARETSWPRRLCCVLACLSLCFSSLQERVAILVANKDLAQVIAGIAE